MLVKQIKILNCKQDSICPVKNTGQVESFCVFWKFIILLFILLNGVDEMRCLFYANVCSI